MYYCWIYQPIKQCGEEEKENENDIQRAHVFHIYGW